MPGRVKATDPPRLFLLSSFFPSLFFLHDLPRAQKYSRESTRISRNLYTIRPEDDFHRIGRLGYLNRERRSLSIPSSEYRVDLIEPKQFPPPRFAFNYIQIFSLFLIANNDTVDLRFILPLLCYAIMTRARFYVIH